MGTFSLEDCCECSFSCLHLNSGALRISHHVRSAFSLAMHLVSAEDDIAFVHNAGEGDTKALCAGIFLPCVADTMGQPGQVPHRALTPRVWGGSSGGVCVAWSGRYSLLRSVKQCCREILSIDFHSHPLQRRFPMKVRRCQRMVNLLRGRKMRLWSGPSRC